MVKTLDKLTEYGVELTGYLHDASPEMSHRASRPAVISARAAAMKFFPTARRIRPRWNFLPAAIMFLF